MNKKGVKSLDLGIWLILQMGPDEAGRLIRRARGGDASARSQLEHCMIKFLQNPGLAAAVMEDASLLDVELVPAEPRSEGGKADWKRLRLDLPIEKRGRGRPPIQRVAALITSLVVGASKKGRPPIGGGLGPAIAPARQVLRNLIRDWRAAEVIPTLSDEEHQTLRPLFGSIVGMADSYTGIPPDFRVSVSGHEKLLPVFLYFTVHRLLWDCIARPERPTRSADRLIGELIGGKSPYQVSLKGGTGNPTKSSENVRRYYLEKSGIRILLEAPREVKEDEREVNESECIIDEYEWQIDEDERNIEGDEREIEEVKKWNIEDVMRDIEEDERDVEEVEWDQAVETAGHIVRRYNTDGLLQRATDGVDMSLKVPWEEIEGFWYRRMDSSWHITKDEEWGVIWIRKERGKPTGRSRRI